ncbi:MmgE/PrpD family protein [Chelativorans xinjiangense]|uniref:MmgE/PrpD family protein n=1 Tax=Chelativorans xinjiangense TaxID=2681485 RepID=UPI0013573610|nr:MmgE/PrpD family protein [Chelativorans xinjiangense]
MTFSMELATRANAIRKHEVPPEAIRIAKRAVLDTLGVALVGSRARFVPSILATFPPATGKDACTTIGHPGKRGMLDAALVNGVSAHAVDFDDDSTTMGGHPSAPVVPGILALAEVEGSGGRTLLEAYVVGFETQTHLARALMPVHYDKGWHPTSTIGTFGAAAACGFLLRLDDARLAAAFSIAASFAAGLKANFGTPVKPLQVGQAARNGLVAALLAKNGIDANGSAFEHPQGFFNLFNGATGFDPEKALGAWHENWEILASGISIKQHPCCGSAHSAIDAAIKLRREFGSFPPDSIAGIEVTLHERRLAHVDRPFPKSGLDAKFSVQFLTAKALLAGAITLDDFDDGGFMTHDTHRLMDVAGVRAHRLDDEYFAEVVVRMRDGTVRRASASTPFGRGRDNPMRDEELRSKFLDCAARAIAPGQASELYERLMRLEQAPDITAIAARLARAPAVLPAASA